MIWNAFVSITGKLNDRFYFRFHEKFLKKQTQNEKSFFLSFHNRIIFVGPLTAHALNLLQ